MSYKVLYRKYRPKAFSDVVGQNQVTQTLKGELEAGRIAHAYLFTGSRGTGKTTCAKIMSKAVNCLNLQDGDPCNVCENCVGIDNGTIMDVMEIDAAGNNRVDDVRSLIEEVAFTPSRTKYRVYIIDEVHELSTAAFNALLKTLEEPPPHAIFILATTEVQKLLSTILSRCQRFDFRRITPDDIAGRLELIAEKENVYIDHDAALLIARIADGGMRDAISILDQCIGRSKEIDCGVVEETAGIVGRQHVFSLTNAILSGECSVAIQIISDLYDSSKDLSKLCEELTNHFRYLMLVKTMGDDKGSIVMSEDELSSLKEQAVGMPLSMIIHSLDSFQRTLDKMRYSNQRIELEMTFVRLCSPELDNTSDALIRRIEALEQRKFTVSATDSIKELRKAAAEVDNTPKSNISSDIIKLSENAQPFTDWAEVIHQMKNVSMTVGMAFAKSNAYISGDYVLVDGTDMVFEYLRSNPQYKDNLRDAIFAITGKNYRLGPYRGKKVSEKKDATDPCDELIKKANDAGIKVNIKEE